MSGLLFFVLRTPKPIASKDPAVAMMVGLTPGRKSATFWLFRTASTASAPTTKVVLSLVAASAFGCEAVEKTDALVQVVLVSVSFIFLGSYQNVKKTRCVREATSFHLSDAVVVSCC
jgi:hypothetical protein